MDYINPPRTCRRTSAMVAKEAMDVFRNVRGLSKFLLFMEGVGLFCRRLEESPVSLSAEAMKVAASRKKKVQSWYLDVNLLSSYWGQERVYHHTAPISMNYGLHEALRLVLVEGLINRFQRHEKNHHAGRDAGPGGQLPHGQTAAGAQLLQPGAIVVQIHRDIKHLLNICFKRF